MSRQPTLFDLPPRVRVITPREMLVEVAEGEECYFLPGHVTEVVARASMRRYLNQYDPPCSVADKMERERCLREEMLIAHGYIEDAEADEDEPRSWFKNGPPGEEWTKVELDW